MGMMTVRIHVQGGVCWGSAVELWLAGKHKALSLIPSMEVGKEETKRGVS